jgi:hypothetical protein
MANPNPIEIRWKKGDGLKNGDTDAANVRDYFIEWSGEGGLPEAFNDSLQASLGFNVILSNSGNDGVDYMEFTVNGGWREPATKRQY